MLKHHKPMLEIEHISSMQKNKNYIRNTVQKALDRGDTTIVFDPTKLKVKVYSATNCYLFNRDGTPMTKMTVDSVKYLGDGITETVSSAKKIVGVATVWEGDRFNKYEGRRVALLKALEQVKFTSKDKKYKDLLFFKLFLRNFELNNNVDSVTWEFADLWQAIVDLQIASVNGDPQTMAITKDNLDDKIKAFSQKYYTDFVYVINDFVSTLIEYSKQKFFDLQDGYILYRSFIFDDLLK